MLFRFSALALALLPAPLLAQGFVQPIGASDADRLAEQVRRLGANPRDLDALLSAAELSIRLDDLSAAGSFLARADRVTPGSPRALAVRAAILVRSERPGEALRLFTQAEAMGWPAARLAADRGFAYDLVGEQRRAQADYRLAMRSGDMSDEVRRRLALSLAIAGKQREALDELAPLVRRNDRGAWRARAFVLAMGGNATEALTIAQTMMPPGSAQGLQAFFAELPRLPATDRAFAVHFGQVRPTAERLADARLAPYLAPLPPEPVQVAAVAPPPAQSRERGRRGRSRSNRTQAPVAAPVQVAVAERLPPPPAYQAPLYPAPSYTPPSTMRPPAGRVLASNSADRPLTPGEQASLAAATLRSARSRGRAAPVAPPPPVLSAAGQASLAIATPPIARPPQLATTPARPAPVPTPVAPASSAPLTPTVVQPLARAPVAVAAVPVPQPSITTVSAAPVAAAPASPVATAAPPPALVPTPERMLAAAPVAEPPADTPSAPATVTVPVTVPTVSVAASEVLPPPTEAALADPAPSAPAVVAAPAPAPVAAPALPSPVVERPPVQVAVAPPPRPPARVSRAQADDILARIVANLSIPASELGVSGPAAGRRTARATDALAPERKPAAKMVAAKVDPKTAVPAKGDKTALAKDEKPTDKKLAAGKKAVGQKKAATEKPDSKAVAAKADKKGTRAEPARIWVQVAGGANEGDLDKAWSSVRAKAPAAFKGRQGYTVPLRATNRVLTGPFKTDAEARAYVNQLAKSGVSAFTVKSEAGQKVSRLDAK
jgi:Flp pilus assembly protein TadD